MRYVLGVKIYDKKTKKEKEFLYIYSKIGYSSIKTIDSIKKELEEGNKIKTFVFYNSEEAQKEARTLAINYRRDDVWQKPWEKSKRIITFYPIKIDNNKFPFLIEGIDKEIKDGIYFYKMKKERK